MSPAAMASMGGVGSMAGLTDHTGALASSSLLPSTSVGSNNGQHLSYAVGSGVHTGGSGSNIPNSMVGATA